MAIWIKIVAVGLCLLAVVGTAFFLPVIILENQKKELAAAAQQELDSLLNPLGGVDSTPSSSFVSQVWYQAVQIGNESQILPSIILAQAILESASGTSGLTKDSNNLFGIKGDYNGQYVLYRTMEYDSSGNSYYIDAKFRKYPSWTESLNDHAQFLLKNSRYKKVIGEKNYKTAAQELQAAGYATDPAYASMLIQVIESNNLARFDMPIELLGSTFLWPYPTNHTVASGYGMRVHPISGEYKLHTGIDIGGQFGDPLVAAAAGTVTLVNTPIPNQNKGGSGYGNYLIITHANGLSTVYAHCKDVTVKQGDIVAQGQTIATCGSTGSSTGAHLHFEIRENNTPIDPMKYLKG